jgi:hypothetical protein
MKDLSTYKPEKKLLKFKDYRLRREQEKEEEALRQLAEQEAQERVLQSHNLALQEAIDQCRTLLASSTSEEPSQATESATGPVTPPSEGEPSTAEVITISSDESPPMADAPAVEAPPDLAPSDGGEAAPALNEEVPTLGDEVAPALDEEVPPALNEEVPTLGAEVSIPEVMDFQPPTIDLDADAITGMSSEDFESAALELQNLPLDAFNDFTGNNTQSNNNCSVAKKRRMSGSPIATRRASANGYFLPKGLFSSDTSGANYRSYDSLPANVTSTKSASPSSEPESEAEASSASSVFNVETTSESETEQMTVKSTASRNSSSAAYDTDLTTPCISESEDANDKENVVTVHTNDVTISTADVASSSNILPPSTPTTIDPTPSSPVSSPSTETVIVSTLVEQEYNMPELGIRITYTNTEDLRTKVLKVLQAPSPHSFK